MQKPCPLEEGHPVSAFTCEEEELNRFIRVKALTAMRSNHSVTYVALDDNSVAGFYTLAFGAIEHAKAPERMKKGLARHAIPMLLIARLARDLQYKGTTLGKGLLRDALEKAIIASEIAGLRAVVVDAKDEKAKKFYLSNDFIDMEYENPPYRLYLLLKDLKKMLSS